MKECSKIHATAIVGDGVCLGADVEIGPFSIIEDGAEIGDRCRISSHVRIEGTVKMGQGNQVFQGAVLGSPPQDLKFSGEQSWLRIGDNNVIREYATMNPGTADGEETRIGDNCLLMAYSHVAHNCVVGNNVIIANSVNLAGHVEVGDFAILGGVTPVHQFVRIGIHSFIGGGSRVPQDMLPFFRGAGNPMLIAGINTLGLQRRKFQPAQLKNLRTAYRLIYREKLNTTQAMDRMASELPDDPNIQLILDFIKGSERGITKNKAD
jgi:UDP-N-acetylglucosamine acyltransferase